MNKGNLAGHLAAGITVIFWGTTFVSTKVLLESFQPMEVLFFRFLIGLVALFVARPQRMRWRGAREELLFAAAGLCGVTLYFALENIALTYTLASNVGVITSIAPFFTALLARRFLDGERPRWNFYVGFVAAICGIALISFNGVSTVQINPIGDLLTVGSAAMWAVYTILTRKIGRLGLHTIQTTRRIFAYGLLFFLPLALIMPFRLGVERFSQPVNLLNILFLGLGASAICFVTWNFAVDRLGAVHTSVYIYLVPVVTITTSVLVLGEALTWMVVVGAALTLSGLVLSERRVSARRDASDGDAVTPPAPASAPVSVPARRGE